MGRIATEHKTVVDLKYMNQSKALDNVQSDVYRWQDGELGGI